MKKSQIYAFAICAVIDTLKDGNLMSDEVADMMTVLCEQRSLELYAEKKAEEKEKEEN